MTNGVIALKLTSGEEVIGRVEYDDAQTLQLSKVRVVLIQPMANQQVGVGFMPFMACNPDGVIPLNKTCIVGEVHPNSDMEKAYLQQTSSIKLMG
jgi:hypothetical protein